MNDLREKEVKLSVPGQEGYLRVRAWLEKRCRPVKRTLEIDEYFAHPCRSFAQTDEALRLRRDFIGSELQCAQLTYKGPRARGPLKEREEITVRIYPPSSYEEARAILERLGFKTLATVEKEREEYDCAQFSAFLDKVKGLGVFLEIELKAEGDASAIFEALGELEGQSVRLQTVDRTYLELLLSKSGASG